MSFPAEDVLDALELTADEPSLHFLTRLFARFNLRVPFETASKILRNADVADPAEKPRVPEVFWGNFLEQGAGGTCFARVAAFEMLLATLGFAVRTLMGAVTAEGDHAALAVTLEAKDWICDVGFPLPTLLACAEGETDTPLGAVALSRTRRGWKVELVGGVPEGPRSFELFDTAVSPEEFSRRWQATFLADSKFLAEVFLRRQLSERIVSFARGELRVDDLHSRSRIPLPRPRAPLLAGEFGVDASLLERALAIAGDPDSEASEPEISAYLETRTSPQAAFRAIASPEGYAKLMEGAARLAAPEPAGEGWRVTLLPPEPGPHEAGSSLQEEITPDAARLSLRVQRGSRRSFYEAATRESRNYLVRRAPLPWPAGELLRNDSLRGRLAGTLAVDLLAWQRLFNP